MRAYFAYDEGGIEELGEATREQVPLLIKQAEASLSGGKQFGVGFYRTERDFVEVRPVGKSQYMIWSDLISGNGNRGFLARLLQRRRTSIKSSQDAIWPLQLPATTLIVRR